MNYQQNDWAALLPAVEFTYNNAPSATTGISPFFVNKGYHPRLMVDSSTPVTSAGAQHVRACLRLGMCYILVLAELRHICRTDTQGDKSLLDAWAEMRRKLSSHSARVWLYITGGQHRERS